MSEPSPIKCAVCRDVLAQGARVFTVDATSVRFGELVTQGSVFGGRDFIVEANDPAVCCSKACARQALKNL